MINIDAIAKKVASQQLQAEGIVDIVDMGAKPIVLPPGLKRQAQKAVIDAVKETYYFSIPLQGIMDNLAKLGILVIQEDGTEWSGFLTGTSGRATFELGWEGRPVKNVAMQMTWYKMPSGKYEIVAYLA